MAKLHRAYSKLAKFASIEFADAERRFKLARVSKNWSVEDLFGDPPSSVFVHAKSVNHAGHVRINVSGDYAGIYIIDGDLTVGGTLELAQYDGGALLLVTGSVRAKNLGLLGSAHLWIAGNLTVGGAIVDDLTDAGGLVVRGTTTAKTIVQAGRGNSRELANKPKTTLVESDALPEPHHGLDGKKLLAAIEKGTDVTAAPKLKPGSAADVTKLKPSAAMQLLTKFTPASYVDTVKRYGIAKLRDARALANAVKGEEKPKPAFVHVGNVETQGTLSLISVESYRALYVIAGDLTVDGTLALATDSPHRELGLLVVTGNVRATRLSIGHSTDLWVGGDLTIDDCLVCSNSVHVKGALRGGAIVISGLMPTTTNAPEAKIISYDGYNVSYFDPVPSFASKLRVIPFRAGLKPPFAKAEFLEVRSAVAKGMSVVK